jgi:hypothetical protein
MTKGRRRFLAYLSTLGGIILVELVNPVADGGMSMYGQVALLGSNLAYFGGVAVDKFKNGGDDGR